MKQVRNTAQRRLVLSIVRARRDHPSADQIYRQARGLDSRISCGTVYRNLNFLADSGEILRLSVPDGPDHFDLRVDDHSHFCCKRCGRVVDASVDTLGDLSGCDFGLPGYRVDRCCLVLSGVCPDCLPNSTESTEVPE